MERAKRPPDGVDAYIAAAPKNSRQKLKEIRAAIKTTAPAAEERLSYGIPYYHYNGRLAYFAHWKAHVAIYLPTPVIEKHKNLLKAYETSKATIRFPLNRKLPIALIKKLVRSRMKTNESRSAQ
jgi:uncharacterized protein YdhG (YjbR/CyaY superfamily)